jgi:hypothetical protein
VCTSALANRAPVAVKVGFSQRLFWALSMHKSHAERRLDPLAQRPDLSFSTDTDSCDKMPVDEM